MVVIFSQFLVNYCSRSLGLRRMYVYLSIRLTRLRAPVPEDEQAQRLIKFSLDTGAVSAEITNVPHQPTRFAVRS